MISSEHKREQRLSWPVVLVPVLLVLLGLVGYGIFRTVWSWMEVRAAEELLDKYDHTGRRSVLAQGREQLRACLAKAPADGRLHFLAARAARQANDYDDARSHLRQAAKLGWVKEAIDFEEALTEVQQGKLGRREGALVALVEPGQPDRLLVLEALVQGYGKAYRLPQALHCLNQWLEAEPNHARALLQRGELELLMRQVKTAQEDLLRGLELDPEEDDSRQKLADILLSEQEAAKALPHYEELRRHRPDGPEVLLGLARCKLALNEVEQATALLDQLLARHPHHAGALAERGKLFQAAGKLKQAEEMLRESVTLDPFQREAVFAFHLCLQNAGKKDEAAKWLQQFEAIKADQEKLAEVEAKLRQSQGDVSLHTEMGRILLRNGQTVGGLQWLRSALAIDPKYQPALDALAEHEKRMHSGQRPSGRP
jgi:tetratricopeptide (TPR) repeat protein